MHGMRESNFETIQLNESTAFIRNNVLIIDDPIFKI